MWKFLKRCGDREQISTCLNALEASQASHFVWNPGFVELKEILSLNSKDRGISNVNVCDILLDVCVVTVQNLMLIIKRSGYEFIKCSCGRLENVLEQVNSYVQEDYWQELQLSNTHWKEKIEAQITCGH